MQPLRRPALSLASTVGIASSVAIAVALAGTPIADAHEASEHAGHGDGVRAAQRSPLVQKVRDATARFVDINVAITEGWKPATPCVSGPTGGAMGVHFVLPSRIPDGQLNASEPEALIYEPGRDGSMRLVGVEFIVIADDWAKAHPEGGAPSVDGHLTNYVGAPNRYGLPAFHELHVWAWEGNPQGSFADWNTQVSCERQRPD